MKLLLIIPVLFFHLASSAQQKFHPDSLLHHQHRFAGHHGRDSVRHATIEKVFDEHPDLVRTFTTTSDEPEYIDTLRTNISDHNGVFFLYLEGTAPNGHIVTDTKTVVVGNHDGHNMLLHKHEEYAKQWGEEQAQGSFWNVGIPSGGGLIVVSVHSIRNKPFVWRYLKLQ